MTTNHLPTGITTFVHEGRTYKADVRFPTNYRQHNAKFFIWDEISSEAEFEAALDEKAAEMGLNTKYTNRGDYPILDKMWDKMNKEIVRGKRALLDAFLSVNSVVPTKVAFSRYCGCSCPCSPGFNVKGIGAREVYISLAD